MHSNPGLLYFYIVLGNNLWFPPAPDIELDNKRPLVHPACRAAAYAGLGSLRPVTHQGRQHRPGEERGWLCSAWGSVPESIPRLCIGIAVVRRHFMQAVFCCTPGLIDGATAIATENDPSQGSSHSRQTAIPPNIAHPSTRLLGAYGRIDADLLLLPNPTQNASVNQTDLPGSPDFFRFHSILKSASPSRMPKNVSISR